MILERLFVDASVHSHPETERMVRRLKLPVERVDDPTSLFQSIKHAPDPVTSGKRLLFLTRNKGGFLKPCPGTRQYICCGYQILHIGSFCGMDCSYCILQTYFHPPLLQFFVNREDLDKELNDLFAKQTVSRVGTGEFTDSLIWQPWSDLTEHLVSRFATQQRAVLELKTKTVAVDRLKGLDHRRKTILAWSLNTPGVIQSEERFTAGLDARLAAAQRCQQWGYPLAFHFDPMVIYDGCEKDYQRVIRRLFQRISAHNIVWISLGTLRFMPALKPTIARRFPDSRIIYGELITGLDNKMRYFKPLRIALYRRVVDWIRHAAPDVTLYFCMEDGDVWEKSMGMAPAPEGGLGRMLDQRAIAVCDLKP